MISIAYDVGNYREILGKTVRNNSSVIEIGPHTGKSTLSYIAKAGRVVAVDKATQSRDKFRKIMKDYPNLSFVQGDARSFSTVRKVMKITDKCDVFAIDMGGGRYPDTVFKVWAIWSGVFRPKHSIIRSRGIAEFVRRAKVKDETLPKKFSDDGWLSSYGRSVPYRLRKQLEEFRYWVNINQPLR